VRRDDSDTSDLIPVVARPYDDPLRDTPKRAPGRRSVLTCVAG
jgi:hypothetical protein